MPKIPGRGRRQQWRGGVVRGQKVGGRLHLQGQEGEVVGQPRVDEGGGLGRVVDEKGLAIPVLFALPAGRKISITNREHIDQSNQVPVVLVAFKGGWIPPDPGDHVLNGRSVHEVGGRMRHLLDSQDEIGSADKLNYWALDQELSLAIS